MVRKSDFINQIAGIVLVLQSQVLKTIRFELGIVMAQIKIYMHVLTV